MKKFKIITLALIISLGTGLTINKVCSQTTTPTIVRADVPQQQAPVEYVSVNPLDVVANPYRYLRRNIKIKAKFDKFSTLGLDYKPAFKSSEEYISFLIKRDDTSYDIPLSELKLFIKRDEAEKFIDLKSNDEISITGTVFSDALGDAWVDVKSLKIIKKAPEKDGVK